MFSGVIYGVYFTVRINASCYRYMMIKEKAEKIIQNEIKIIASSKIHGLDGLRGIAASIVLLTHMSGWGYNLFGIDFHGIGRSGVVLFFVLSSFLLTSQILSWTPQLLFSPKRWLSYLEARILRIWPLFLCVLAFSLFTSYLHLIPIIWRAAPIIEHLPVRMTWDSLQEHLLMRKGEDILWTIPVEFKFYLLLPLILMAIMIPLRNHRAASISVLGTVILTAFWLTPVASGNVNTFPFIGVFLTGVLLAIVRRHDIEKKNICQLHLVLYELLAWLCFAIFVCLIPSVYFYITNMVMPITADKGHSLYATLWALMILCMLRGSGFMRLILDSRLLVFLGMISFSLYLWHRIPINLMHRLTYFHYIDFLSHEMKTGIIMLMSIGMAYLSYTLIEHPILQWKARRKTSNINDGTTDFQNGVTSDSSTTTAISPIFVHLTNPWIKCIGRIESFIKFLQATFRRI